VRSRGEDGVVRRNQPVSLRSNKRKNKCAAVSLFASPGEVIESSVQRGGGKSSEHAVRMVGMQKKPCGVSSWNASIVTRNSLMSMTPTLTEIKVITKRS
jgi:hypothetical protein